MEFTYVIKTLGCKVNQYESRALSERLEEAGFRCARKGQAPDIVMINTCAVTEESVRKAKQMTRQAANRYPHASILIAGCGAQLEKETFASLPHVTYVCGTRNKNTVIAAAMRIRSDAAMREAPVVCVTPPIGDIEPMRITGFSRTRAYVKIQDGCDGRCSYCIIPSLRGKVCSRDAEEIVKEVSDLVKGECREVVLTGIETSAYEYDLAGLMERLDGIPGLHRIRLGSLDPSFMKPEFVFRIAKLPSVAKHFHLSLQSGSNTVLGRMRRRYRIETALENIATLRETIPGVQFSTDIIVGFPGETEEEFAQTAKIAEQIGFLHIHVFPYSKRPGTPAAEMENQVEEGIKHARVKALTAVSEQSLDRILSQMVREGRVLDVIAEQKREDGRWIGHSSEFVEVSFADASSEVKRGDAVLVKAERKEETGVSGELLYRETIEKEKNQ